jgi:hypothetical protein
MQPSPPVARVQSGAVIWLLGAVVVVGLALRLTYLAWSVDQPCRAWVDPDHYLDGARLLRPVGGTWHWDPSALTWFGLVRAPLFVFGLALLGVAELEAYSAVAWLGVALDALALVGAYLLGSALYGPRSGLVAAAGLAIWFPAVAASTWIRQERVYLPLLVLGLGLLADATRRSAAPRRFGLAGAALGLAALARSMPLYFLPVAAVVVARTGATGDLPGAAPRRSCWASCCRPCPGRSSRLTSTGD